MTPEQRKRVAETITKRPHKIADGSVFCTFPSWSDYIYWIPSFTGTPEQRSQALAVVEWIANEIDQLPLDAEPNKRIRRIEFQQAIRFKDTEYLLSLALELSDE